MQKNEQPILEIKNITKHFGTVVALKDANLKVYGGKVMGLVGENGAGKSTLMKIISGVITADSGEMIYQNRLVQFKNVHESRQAGIAIIHQELNLIPYLSVAENLFLGQEPLTVLGTVHRSVLHKRAKELLKLVHLDHINLSEPVKNYSLAHQQMFEIAKALVFKPTIIIMDEPTSSLPDNDAEELFKIIHQLRADGVGIVYISHRMDEVFALSDDITVLRDGQFITEQPREAVNKEQMIEYIVGRKITERYPYIKVKRGNEILQFHQLWAKGVHNVSATVYQGEILGLFGLVGAGRTELAHTLYGLQGVAAGKVSYQQQTIRLKSPAEALAKGIVYVSEDRKGDGLVLGMSVAANTTLSILDTLKGVLGRLLHKKDRELAAAFIQKLAVKVSHIDVITQTLSGGNQQKVALARALVGNPKLLILDEPTRGIDVGAKKEIYDMINTLKEQGLAVMLISSDLSEVMGLSDRIMVLAEGRLQATLNREETTSEKIMAYAMGR